MITCYIRKQTTGKLQSTYSVLHNRMTAHLHEHILTSCLNHLCQQGIQSDRVRSSMICRNSLTVYLVHHRREQSRLMSHCHEHIIQHGCNSSLAVRSRHTHQLQLLSRIAVEISCNLPHHLFSILHSHISYTLHLLRHFFTYYDACTLLNSLTDERMSVHGSSPHSYKHLVLTHIS